LARLNKTDKKYKVNAWNKEEKKKEKKKEWPYMTPFIWAFSFSDKLLILSSSSSPSSNLQYKR
jgi:hypothetical protein